MKILFSVTHTSEPGNDLHSTLAVELKNRGHDIDCLQFSHHPQWDPLNPDTKSTIRSFDSILESKGIRFKVTTNGRWFFNWILYHRWRRVVKQALKKNEYDVVVSANICVTPTTLAATELGVPAVILTTGPAAVRYNSKSTRLDKSPRFLDMPLNSKIQYPFIYAIHEMNKCAFTNADEVVAINEFDASITYETFNRDPVVSYIPVDLSNYEVNNWSPKNVTLVNPRTKNKGLDIFLDISRQLPNVNFQIVGDLYENSKKRAIRKLTNVEYLGYEKDMKKVYENTKLLLVPSKYQEGGPRIIPEAAVNGIPAIGSDLGGIPDYIDKGGEVVSDYNNTTAWVSVIKKYLQDEDYYTKKSQQAREAAMRFKKEDIIDEHEERLQRLIE